MGFALPPSFMAKTSEESADEQYIDVLLARCKVVEDIMGLAYSQLTRISELAKHPQSIEISPSLFVNRDNLIKADVAKLKALLMQC